MVLDLRVSEKGAVSFYGLNRFPFTLYREEWGAVFRASAVIHGFIFEHHSRLSCRGNCTHEQSPPAPPRADPSIVSGHGSSVWCRKSEGGAVSVCGIRRRFPITLYCHQWLRVLRARPLIEEFIRQNDAQLETKGCCVPQISSGSRPRRVPSAVGPDNIIRPLAALRR